MKMQDKHPSQVQVSFSRITSNHPIAFYGSDIKCSSWITLKVSTSRRNRSCSNDFFFADGVILELRLSPNQFSELLTTMNCGSGVPATLTYHNNTATPHGEIEAPVEIDKKEEFHLELDAINSETKDALAELKLAFAELKVTKKEKEKINHLFTLLQNRIFSDLPFIVQQAKKQIDKTVSAGKAVLDCFYTGLITKLGIKALQEKPTVEMIESKKED